MAITIGITITCLLAGCSSLSPLDLELSVKEQEVPLVLAIGPFETSNVRFEGNPVPKVEATIQKTFLDTVKRTAVFKDVLILKLESTEKSDAEKILNLARSQNADLLMTGEVKEFQGEMGLPLPRTHFGVRMKLSTELYNIHTGQRLWRKTDVAQVARDEWGREEVLETIVRNVSIPSLSAGLLPSMIAYIQTAYAEGMTAKAKSTDEASSVFGGAELAKIDAELIPPATTTRLKDNAYAIVVGVEDYRDLPKVDYARRDAEWVKKYLIKAMGYREQNVVLLLGDRVTRSQLVARFENWLPKQVKESNDAEIFIYYGGHGAPDPNTNQAFLVPYDGDPGFLEATAYPVNRLYKILNDLPARAIMVALDTCFSGAGGRSVIAKGTRPMLIKVEGAQVTGPNMVVLTAAAGNQVSSAFMEKRHGLFTYYFLKGLQGDADADKDGVVDLQELNAYVTSNVEAVARRMNVDQTPQLLPAIEMLGNRAKAPLVQLKPQPSTTGGLESR